MAEKPQLIYVYDPMCVWCYAFAPKLKEIEDYFAGKVEVKKMLGGLAPDCDETMPEGMQNYIKRAWRNVEKNLHQKLNFDFWEKCRPMRSTYPACRAVIAARHQQKESEMTEKIQHAYYQEARNPSEADVLIELAVEIGLDKEGFEKDFKSEETSLELQSELKAAHDLEICGFPSLVLSYPSGNTKNIELSYRSLKVMIEQIERELIV